MENVGSSREEGGRELIREILEISRYGGGVVL